jgi:plastocyanin
MTRLQRTALLIPALAVALAGCGKSGGSSGSSSSAAPLSATVQMASYKFAPPTVTIKAGGKVTWIDRDADVHTATSDPGSQPFDTDTVKTGKSKTLTFSKAGTYRYHCVYHAFMEGTVVVKQGA